jgi:serine/threonine protein kinase
MPPPTTAEQLLEQVSKSGLLDPPRLEEYAREQRAAGVLPPTPQGLADALVRDGLLTRFQAEQLLAGRSRNFILSGKYKVLRPLGAGAMGQVFLCEHAVMRRLVAVKLLPSGLASDPAAVERFHREARAVARLHHPNIITAHDADRDGNRHFLVMEYIDGHTLDQLVRQVGPLPAARAAHYIRQAALGLQHAHEHGLVHRDIKPSNLLVDRAGTVKVLDLGLARFFHDEADDLTRRQDHSPMGTTDYIAPEQAEESHAVDIRADVYALGCTLYHLLTGQVPFPGGTPLQKLRRHQDAEPRPAETLRPDLPGGLASVLRRMMAKRPEDRYQTPGEVAETLASWAQPGPPPPLGEAVEPASPAGDRTPLEALPTLTTSPPSPGEPADPAEGAKTVLSARSRSTSDPAAPRRPAWGQRRAWLVAAGLAALLVGAVAVGFVLFRPDKSEHNRPPDHPGPTGEAAVPRLRLLVPAYFYPAAAGLAEWERLLKAPDPAAVVIIANPDSGPGSVADPNFVRILDQAREKGFTVIGYVSTKYAKRPADQVKEDVDRWVRLYPGVTGIFFDEQASAADWVDHYVALYEYARKQRGLRLVVNNPGTTCAEEYLSRPTADVVCLVESAKDFSPFRLPAWAVDYPAGRFAALIAKVDDPEHMKRYVLAMAEKHLGSCYVTDNKLANQWERLPSYWEAELDAVRQANERKEP